MSELAAWGNFYSIVGSAAGALIAVSAFEAGALLLLFIGIHNAWDGVVYHVVVNMRDTNKE